MLYTDLLDKVLNQGRSIFEADEVAPGISSTGVVSPPKEQEENLDPEEVKNFDITDHRYEGLDKHNWVITKPEWLAVDPELVERLANVQNLAMFERDVKKLARELGTPDQKRYKEYRKPSEKHAGGWVTVKAKRGVEDPRFVDLYNDAMQMWFPPEPEEGQTKGESDGGASYQALMQEIRYEARAVFDDVKDPLPRNHPLKRKQIKPDKLFMSQHERELSVAQQRDQSAVAQKALADKNPKYGTFYGDEVYGVFDKESGEMVAPEPGSKVRFKSEAEAEKYLLDNQDEGGFDVFDDPDRFEIRKYKNDKSLAALKDTVAPLENGWTTEEVIQALVPWIYKIANKYRPHGMEYPSGPKDIHHFGEMEQAIVAGNPTFNPDGTPVTDPETGKQTAHGILGALANDRGDAPFGKYVWKYMASAAARAAQKGLISGPSDKSGKFGRGGVVRAWVVFWPDEKGEMHSQSFPSEPSGYEAARQSALKHGKNLPSAGPRTNDGGYKKAMAFKNDPEVPKGPYHYRQIFLQRIKTLKAEGGSPEQIQKIQDLLERIMVVPDRPGVTSGDAPVGGEGSASGDGENAGSVMDLKRGKEPNPLKVVSDNDFITQIIRHTDLSPIELKAVLMMAGMDDPEMGRMGTNPRSQESGEDSRKPGQQSGKDPNTAVKRDSLGRVIKGDSVENNPLFARSWTDVANMGIDPKLGNPIPGTKITQAWARAIPKLRMTADRLSKPLKMRRKMTGPVNPHTGEHEGTPGVDARAGGIPESVYRSVMEMFERYYIKALLNS